MVSVAKVNCDIELKEITLSGVFYQFVQLVVKENFAVLMSPEVERLCLLFSLTIERLSFTSYLLK